ncbi:ABC transporter permease [Paenibacillus sp. MBLB4367]|uniref:ABC transporter permease n=1 Tax=Paenibacillus sp. MBLB4367 TaxID=3384767 RepID=UPI003908293E
MLNEHEVSKLVLSKPVRRRKVRFRTLLSLYALFAPTAILLIVFNYMPMYGIIIAFKNYSVYKGVMASDWVGLEHFKYVLKDDKFWSILKNTLILNFYDLLFGFTAPIVFALLANELFQKTFKRVMQTISYLPHFLSWIVVSGVFYSILSPQTGLFNHFLGWFGIEPIYFMTEPGIFRGLLVFADIWKNVGWSAILYFAVIAGIDSSLYEAAWIDGASRWRQVVHITLPHMLPMIMLLFLLRLAHIFEVGFERVFLMQNPLVYDVSDVISTYVYRLGLEQSQYSLTTAIGFMQSVLGFLLLVISNRLSKKLTGLGLY